MASFSQFYYPDNYVCSDEFTTQLPADHLITSSAITAPQLTLPFSSDMNGASVSSMVPFDSDISCSSTPSSSSSLSSIAAALSYPTAEPLGPSDTTHDPALVGPTSYATLSGSLFGISGNEGLSSGAANYCHQHDRAYDFGDQECGAPASNFWPLYPRAMTSDNWEIQGGVAQRMEEATLKVSRYSAEERKDRILRYLKKRSQRNFNKTIKYACRKTLADKRVRVRGRFARNNECCEDDQTLVLVKTDSNLQQADSCYNIPADDQIMKSYDEEWLQEAIASLMCYRIAPDNGLELPDKYLMN